MSTLGWEEARQRVVDVVSGFGRPVPQETVPLEQAHGRVLAEDVAADRDYPALRRSLRDGFAVQCADLPGVLRIRGEVRAGEAQEASLRSGEALEIMTGAPVPDFADAVVMVEHVTRVTGGDGAAQVRIEQRPKAGEWINERGSEARQGELLVKRGVRLDASHISALAMAGHTRVRVFARPRVAILATGDEIVPVTAAPAGHQIRNSNSFMLAALVKAAGGEAEILPVAADTAESLERALADGLTRDMLLVSGGVSAGRYDLVKPALGKLGVTFEFEKVRIQPGGPCAFGTRESIPVFGLPGNPGSSYVTFQVLAQAALDLISGQHETILPLLRASFAAPFKHRLGLTRFLPARLEIDGGQLTHIPWQGSSDIPALAKANVFLVADADRESWSIGDSIRVMRKL